jgi:nicotinamide phosphoribosyltransferase
MKPNEIQKQVITDLQRMVREMPLDKLYSNLLGKQDFYKYTHHLQYVPGLDNMQIYFEPRVGGQYPKICYFGLQIEIKENLLSAPDFYQLLLMRAWVKSAGGFDYFAMEAWKRVSELGYVPIDIFGLPEGIVVREGTPCFYFTSTDPFFAKHMSTLEDMLMHTWASTTISSRCLNIENALIPLFQMAGCINDLKYSFFDFSLRSASCTQEAVRKGAAFLLHFFGSDNTPADIIGIMKHYNGPQVLKSVYATEHSTALTFGPGEGELEYIIHQLETAPKDAIVSFLIDTNNSKNFMENVIGHPRVIELIKERTAPTVARPDSGEDQEEIDMCFYYFEKYFGSHVEHGYKVLNNQCKVLMGNSIDEDNVVENYVYIMGNGWSPKNLVQASGNGLMTKNVSRDSLRCAIKPNLMTKNGVDIPLQKKPIGSPFKWSKAGEIKVYIDEHGQYQTATSATMDRAEFGRLKSEFVHIYHNGQLLEDWTYEEVVAIKEATRDLF